MIFFGPKMEEIIEVLVGEVERTEQQLVLSPGIQGKYQGPSGSILAGQAARGRSRGVQRPSVGRATRSCPTCLSARAWPDTGCMSESASPASGFESLVR